MEEALDLILYDLDLRPQLVTWEVLGGDHYTL